MDKRDMTKHFAWKKKEKSQWKRKIWIWNVKSYVIGLPAPFPVLLMLIFFYTQSTFGFELGLSYNKPLCILIIFHPFYTKGATSRHVEWWQLTLANYADVFPSWFLKITEPTFVVKGNIFKQLQKYVFSSIIH
jgi:hypothetical protein